MPTFSSVGHALQFGNNAPTVTIVGTDYDGYIIYDMSTSGTFYQFASNTKYFALQVIFDSPFNRAPGVLINPANATTAAYMTAQPGIEFYVEQSDVDGYQFKISGISSSTPQLGATVLVWSYQVSGTKVSAGSGADSVSNSDGTLTISPTTGSVVAGLNLAHANTWSAKQTFAGHIVVDGYEIHPANATSGQALVYNGSFYVPQTVSGGGATGPRIIPAGFATNSTLGTPTIVAAIQFNPADYSGYTTIKFRAVFANGNSSVSTSVKLHDATHNADIYTTTYSGSTAEQVQEQTLTVSSAGANTIANSASIYEISIYVNSPTTGGTNFIQLYSAELRVA